MVKSYCVKQKKQTKCVEPSGYFHTKNNRLMLFLYLCRMRDKKKTKFVKQNQGNGAARPKGRA